MNHGQGEPDASLFGLLSSFFYFFLETRVLEALLLYIVGYNIPKCVICILFVD